MGALGLFLIARPQKEGVFPYEEQLYMKLTLQYLGESLQPFNSA